MKEHITIDSYKATSYPIELIRGIVEDTEEGVAQAFVSVHRWSPESLTTTYFRNQVDAERAYDMLVHLTDLMATTRPGREVIDGEW